MARYIVRPRNFQASSGVSLAATTLSHSARTAQIKAISGFRAGHPVVREIAAWLNETKTSVRRISADDAVLPATGTLVLDMKDEEAAQLSTEVADLVVIKDQPLELIRPRRAAAVKARVAAKDLWHLDAIGLTRVRRANFDGSGAGITVAVLDTGVDASHPEFDGRAIKMVTYDVDNWTTHSTEASTDTDGHGTHVAGLIAGRRVGVAPRATIINGVMIPGGKGFLSDFILALEWAASRPEVAIVNMSAGIPGFIEGMEEAVEDLLAYGILPVIATGNEGRNRTRSPGNYNPVLSIGACNEYGAVSSFSSSGTYTDNHQIYRVPDLVAPGEAMTSCVQGGGYEAWDGTSMATPVVSAVAALILEKHPTIPVLDLMEALIDSCQDLGISVERQGAGLVQVTAATIDDLNELSGSGAVASRPAREPHTAHRGKANAISPHKTKTAKITSGKRLARKTSS